MPRTVTILSADTASFPMGRVFEQDLAKALGKESAEWWRRRTDAERTEKGAGAFHAPR